jgi:NADH:ubiquinone reductase (H+-translocating)
MYLHRRLIMLGMSTASTASAAARVVIIGCGFGGLEAAKLLAPEAVQVTLIDRTNHHLFQPLLYQVATAGLAAPAIAAPIRHLFRKRANVQTLLGEVSGIHVAARTVQLAGGNTLPYDHLIVAAGATHSYFGNDAWASDAPGLKTLADAFNIRRRILMAFEQAERESDAQKRAALLSFCVIGAGPTGVELAGTLAEISRHALRGEFRHIRSEDAKVLLIEGGARVLQSMPEALSAKALAQLQALGVDVRLNAKVTRVDSEGLSIESASSPRIDCADSYQINSKTVIWAAGVKASPLGAALQAGTGCELDRAGRVKVQPDLSLAGHPEISVIGDLALAMSHAPGQAPKPTPGVSPGAKQMGQQAAANILRRIRGQTTQVFRYRDYGNLATIGRHSAVVDLATPLGPLRFSGLMAWLFWLFAHVYFLIGFRNRLVVLLDWAWAYFTYQRQARVVVEPASEAPSSSNAKT